MRLTATPWVILAGAIVVLLATFGLSIWRARPQPVSAQTVMRRALVALDSPAANGVNSFTMVEKGNPLAKGLSPSYVGQFKESYQAPNLWRLELKLLWPDNSSKPTGIAFWQNFLIVSDGTNVWMDSDWSYTNPTGYPPAPPPRVSVHPAGPIDRLPGLLSQFGQSTSSLSVLLARAGACNTQRLRGSDTIAGRPVFVVDLGPSKCSDEPQLLRGKAQLWVDKETFVVLKDVQYNGIDGSVLSAMEATSIHYNVPLDPSLFTFTPPPGVQVQHDPPPPSTSTDSTQATPTAQPGH